MRTIKLIIAIVMILISLALLLIAFAWPAEAQDTACDLSGAATMQIQRYNPRVYRMGGYIVPRRSTFVGDEILRAPEQWSGTSTWVGYENGGLTEAHLSAPSLAALTYYDAQGSALHWVEIKADADAVYVMIMPANLRDGYNWHGCVAFEQPRGGTVEAWLDSLVG